MSERCFDLAWTEFSARAARWTRAEHGDEQAEVRYYAEKHLNTWSVDLKELPGARTVVLLRDPRDTFASIEAFNRLREEDGSEGLPATRDRLHAVIARHRERLRWIVGVLESQEAPVVRYEELVRDLPAVARRLEGWFEISLDPAAALTDRTLRRRHVTAGSPEDSIGRWRRELDPEVAELFSRELAPELAAVGLDP